MRSPHVMLMPTRGGGGSTVVPSYRWENGGSGSPEVVPKTETEVHVAPKTHHIVFTWQQMLPGVVTVVLLPPEPLFSHLERSPPHGPHPLCCSGGPRELTPPSRDPSRSPLLARLASHDCGRLSPGSLALPSSWVINLCAGTSWLCPWCLKTVPGKQQASVFTGWKHTSCAQMRGCHLLGLSR